MRYIDHSQNHRRYITGATDAKLNKAAQIFRDEIVGVMERSVPSGRIYFRGSGAPRGLERDERADRIRAPSGRFVKDRPLIAGGHQASAPGQPPAIDTGAYVRSWQWEPARLRRLRRAAVVFSDLKVGQWYLATLLELGTEYMEPRPHIRVAYALVRDRVHEILRA
jgi:hypothetical protein